jgi:thioredoxin-dependent peroxiredoxin
MKSLLLFLAVGIFATAAGTFGQSYPYPKPQIGSAIDAVAPDFTLTDQDGKSLTLSSLRGQYVLLFFYRGYWCPYCMTEMSDFADHSDELAKWGVRLIPISVDDQEHTHEVWEKAANKKFTILSDPNAVVIKKYGLLHERGHAGSDIALRTTILVGPDGRERWRRVSHSVPDIPSWDDTFSMIKRSVQQERSTVPKPELNQ